jgi:hypothetical protein
LAGPSFAVNCDRFGLTGRSPSDMMPEK